MRGEVERMDPFRGIVGLRDLKDTARRLAEEESPLLLLGETGVGKNLFAKAIHEASAASPRELVTVHCPSVPPSLFESELFGHRRGAYTDAREERVGAIGAAEGGTVLFDEIGELSLEAQSKLLRVVEERRYCRLGESRERQVEARFLFATNRDLAAMIEDGAFRRDLYFRIATYCLEIPPLRERGPEVAELAAVLWAKATGCQGAPLETAEMDALLSYDFPGNVRELDGLLKRVWFGTKTGGQSRLALLRHELECMSWRRGTQSVPPSGGLSVTSLGTGLSFWSDVRDPYLRREINREELRAFLEASYELAGRSLKRLAPLLGVDDCDYKRFVDFVGRHGFTARQLGRGKVTRAGAEASRGGDAGIASARERCRATARTKS